MWIGRICLFRFRWGKLGLVVTCAGIFFQSPEEEGTPLVKGPQRQGQLDSSPDFGVNEKRFLYCGERTG